MQHPALEAPSGRQHPGIGAWTHPGPHFNEQHGDSLGSLVYMYDVRVADSVTDQNATTSPDILTDGRRRMTSE